MNCLKILVLVSLIPLALRGASVLGGGDVVVVVVDQSLSPEQQSTNAAAARAGVSAPLLRVEEQWRHRRRMGGQSGRARATAFAPRRFGGGSGFFGDGKRFAPTGSNPLHNL